jgi:DNA adenine methylase
LYLKQNGKCALSGTDIEFARTKQEYLQGKTTASLDRINSSSGYTKNNVQWVHKWINKMKSNHSQERFLSLCANVCNYQTHSKKRKVKQKLLRPPFKIHGGKRYLRTWVVGHFPVGYTEMTYVEPYVGAASVLLNKRRSSNELVVDLDPGVIAILTTIRDHSSEFIAKLNETPYCKEVFLEAMTKQHFKTSMDYVVNEMTLRRMSRGGLKKSFSWSARKRGGRPGDENAWKTLIEHLPDISRRLEGVTIERDTAINVINRHKDDPNALFYCDPTYLPETRRSKDTYEFEVSEEEHIELCRVLQSIKGKALISGYHSPLYDDLLRGWKMETKQIANHSSQQKKKQYRTECLWANFSHNQPRNIT